MADIKIYGVIDQGFADDLRRQVLRVPAAEPVELRISSPGGYLSEGVTAYNVLRRAPNEIIAYLDGDAFSAATLLVCAADYAEAPSNVLMMFHEPWLPILSPCSLDECRKTMSYLKATRDQVIDVYNEKTGIGKRKLATMLKRETYMSATEAQGAGFLQNVTGPSADVQNLPLSRYGMMAEVDGKPVGDCDCHVRDEQQLAHMLGKRKIVRDLSSLLTSIGV